MIPKELREKCPIYLGYYRGTFAPLVIVNEPSTGTDCLFVAVLMWMLLLNELRIKLFSWNAALFELHFLFYILLLSYAFKLCNNKSMDFTAAHTETPDIRASRCHRSFLV